MNQRLENKTWLITGASGIAAATARLAAQAGARIFVVSRNAAKCEALAASCGKESGFFAADLTDAAAVAAAIASCQKRFGRMDAVFNVAGISGRSFGDGPVHQCTEAGWDVTLNNNLRSMFLVCREVVGRMLEQPVGSNGLRGAVLNMASVLGFSPEPHFFATHAYAASKGAILSLSRSMAAYYAPHKIRVNVIAPGLTKTPMTNRAQADADIVNFMKVKQPLCGDLIDVDAVAGAAVFLLSDDAAAITGDMLTVDAGWSISQS